MAQGVNNNGQSQPVYLTNADGTDQSGTGATQVQGNSTPGVAESGNPISIGGRADSGAPAAVTAGQRVRGWFGLRGQQMVATVGLTNFATNQVSVGTTATLIVAARPGRGSVKITHITGAQQVFIGNSTVTLANGDLMPAAIGASTTIPTDAAIYGIASTAAQTVSYMEVFNG